MTELQVFKEFMNIIISCYLGALLSDMIARQMRKQISTTAWSVGPIPLSISHEAVHDPKCWHPELWKEKKKTHLKTFVSKYTDKHTNKHSSEHTNTHLNEKPVENYIRHICYPHQEHSSWNPWNLSFRHISFHEKTLFLIRTGSAYF